MSLVSIKQLSIPPREFGHVSPALLARDLVFEWAVLILAGWLAMLGRIETYLLAWMLFSIHQHRLALLGHDGAHFRFAKNKFLNDTVSNVFIFYPLGVTVQGYRSSHFEHHRKTGVPNDPEKFFKRGRSWERPASRLRLVIRFLLDLVGLGSLGLLRLIYSIRTKNAGALAGLAVFWLLAIGLFFYLSWVPILIVFLVSFFTGFWAIFRIRGFTEHVGIQGTYRFEANGLWRYIFFPYFTWCHYEHHEWPHVSYQHLMKARAYNRAEPVLTLGQLITELGTAPSSMVDPAK